MRKLTGIRYVYWLLILLVIVALALCVRQFVIAHHAVKAWQAETERLKAKITQLEMQTESDFYRGAITACFDIGMQMKVPNTLIFVRCSTLIQSAHEDDWFNELRIEPDEPAKRTSPIKGQVAVR